MSIVSVTSAIESRFSCRAFTDQIVPAEALQRIFEKAALSPSGTNLQPWKIHLIEGDSKAKLIRVLSDKMKENVLGEGFDFRVYPENMTDIFRDRRNQCSESMYGVIGIERSDKRGRINHVMRNADFFGAPVGLIVTVDPCVADCQLVDCGIFLQSLMLLAEEEGLNTCAQAFWALWPNTVREVLGIENELVLVGMAIGYGDPDAMINTVRQTRVSTSDFVTVHK